jgi:hypothetical protein
MKMKTTLLAVTGLVASMVASNAALVIVSNVAAGPGDTLYATQTNSLMDGGLVTIGYFDASVTTADIDTIPELFSRLSGFTLLTSAAPGSMGFQFGAAIPGYADQENKTQIGTGPIAIGNPLLGRMLYSIVTSASSLGSATGTSQFALVPIGTITADGPPTETTYVSNPVNAPIIGTIGAFNGDANFGGGEGAYNTLKMTSVPEASTALLGALGALGLLRRRR